MTGPARDDSPPCPRPPRTQRWPALALLVVGACATAGPSEAPGDPAVPPLVRAPTTDAERAQAADRLARARERFRAGDHAAALSEADDIVAGYAATPASTPALLLAARAALELEDFDGADRRARRYAELFPGDGQSARPALEILEESRARRAHAAANRGVRELALGVIVPQSGSRVLERYGELVVQGATLAAETFRAATERDVDLRVRDDGADQARAAELVVALEDGGADGILGPLLTESLLSAAESRRDLDVPMISPTASDHPSSRQNAYTLNAPNPIEAERLADYALTQGYARVAVLYPRSPAHEFLAAAFQARLDAAGRPAALVLPYAPEKTTFRDVIGQMTAARIDAVYAPADQRGIRQLAPQLAFLDAGESPLSILGNDVWASEEVLRLVEPQALEGVVVATSDGRTTGDAEYDAFVQRYESRYRRTLDNPFPALAYDATTLLLMQAAARQNGENAQGIEAGTWHRGATGWVGVRDGIIVRRPTLVRIQDGRPVSIEAAG